MAHANLRRGVCRIVRIEREQAVEVAALEAREPLLCDRPEQRGVAVERVACRPVESRAANGLADIDRVFAVIRLTAFRLGGRVERFVAPREQLGSRAPFDERESLSVVSLEILGTQKAWHLLRAREDFTSVLVVPRRNVRAQ